MKLKEIYETRAVQVGRLEEIVNEIETEGLTKEKQDELIKEFETIKAEIEALDEKVEAIQEGKKIIAGEPANKIEDGEKEMENRSKLVAGETVELRDMTTVNTKGQAVENVAYQAKLGTEAELVSHANVITLDAKGLVPVESKRMDVLVPVGELADAVKNAPEVGEVVLSNAKFAGLVVLSQELVDTESFNIEAEIVREGNEVIQETMEQLLVEGNTTTKAEGLANMKAKGAKTIEMSLDATNIADAVSQLYFGIKKQYRKDAIFVVSDVILAKLMSAKDANGDALLDKMFYTDGFGYRLMGRPVIVSDFAGKQMSFVNMKQAMVMGRGSRVEVVKSTEYGFLNSSIAFRTSTRLDNKITNTDACAVLIDTVAIRAKK